MNEEKKEVHICPIRMKTVILIDGKCTEECYLDEDCVFFDDQVESEDKKARQSKGN